MSHHRHTYKCKTLEEGIRDIIDARPPEYHFCRICGCVPTTLLGDGNEELGRQYTPKIVEAQK